MSTVPASDCGRAGTKSSEARLQVDAWVAKRGGERAMAVRARARLVELVAYARTRSPYYRHLYRGLPSKVTELAALPVTDKSQLMAAFDDWVTDPAITLERARAFAEDPALIGRPFGGHYSLSTTSGTTGKRGIFLHDARQWAVTSAMATRMLTGWLTVRDTARIAACGGRTALVVPDDAHVGGAVMAARLRGRSRVAALSVHRPLEELVEALNDLRPAVLAPSASLGVLLAGQAEAGRLRIAPALVCLGAEGLPMAEHARIGRALAGAKVRATYNANECPFLSYSCPAGWLHVNADWAIVEPVDERYRPVPPGEASHTVLLTNLANRIQPILRYDLGDAVTVRPDPCPCGTPGPALRVQGRAADRLTIPGADGTPVTMATRPVAIVLDTVPGLDLFQIVQTGPATLRLRLAPAPGIDPDDLWDTVRARLSGLLVRRHLGHVRLERASERPQISTGGKIRPFIPATTSAKP
ncbi:hypothetical protein SMC26_08255 [Actinomadura fulvescens]